MQAELIRNLAEVIERIVAAETDTAHCFVSAAN
jgi:hypothetical protein